MEMKKVNVVERVATENPSYGCRGIIVNYDHLNPITSEYDDYDFIKDD